jgi:hypothetical protein
MAEVGKEKREKEGKDLWLTAFLAYISSQTRPKYWT